METVEDAAEEAADAAEEVVEEATETAEEALARQVEWLGGRVNEFVNTLKGYNLDGVLVSFQGVEPLSLREGESAAHVTLQETFFAPLLAYVQDGAKLLFFQGSPKNILTETDVLGPSKYIIVESESATGVSTLDFNLRMAMGSQVPADRYIIGVTAFDVTSETAVDGIFSDGQSAIRGAAQWMVQAEKGVTKAGLCVNHAQFDYYNPQHVYSEISAAIATMNPSPVK